MWACRACGLEAIAVTVHQDMVFVPYIRDAPEKETDEAGRALPHEKLLRDMEIPQHISEKQPWKNH